VPYFPEHAAFEIVPVIEPEGKKTQSVSEDEMKKERPFDPTLKVGP